MDKIELNKCQKDKCAEFGNAPGELINVLHKCQGHFGYLPEEVQREIARNLHIPVAKVYGVVTFYSFFTMQPKGRHSISVCMGTACYVRGAEGVLEELKKELKIDVGGVTPDGKFSLECLRCVGACGLLLCSRLLRNLDSVHIYWCASAQQINLLCSRLLRIFAIQYGEYSMSEYPLTEKLQELKKKYETLSGQLSEPDVMSDMKKYIQLNREYKELEPIVAAGDKYIKMVSDLEGAKEILAKEKDEDLRDLAKEEVSSIEGQLPGMEEEIKLLLIPPQDEKNAIVEIRGGTGGDEAAIFAGDLFRMYAKYCERKGWKLEINSQLSARVGNWKLTASRRVLPVDTRRLSSRYPVRECMVR